MDVVIWLLFFIVIPIAVLLFVGRYFGRLQKESKAKTYDEMKSAMGPRAYQFYRTLIVVWR